MKDSSALPLSQEATNFQLTCPEWKMNLSDLRVFVAVAMRRSLVSAADQLHLTPSAVSKAIRRLETDMATELFDRTSRQLILNPSGARLVERARVLLALAEQARADIQGNDASPECRLAGPAVLLWREVPRVAEALAPYVNATLHANAMFEGDALRSLERGEASAAVVTGAVIDGQDEAWLDACDKVPLGSLSLNLVAGSSHPLVAAQAPNGAGERAASIEAILAHPFACPVRSLFCGQDRGARSDGWRNDAFPRNIRYWTDDLQLLLALVRRGDALAYLPDFALAEPGLSRIHVADSSSSCTEDAWLVWNRQTAPAWLTAAAEAVAMPSD